MTFALRRLLLGLALILACSCVLLLLDLDHRNVSALQAKRKWKVTLVEFNQVADVEESERGVLEGLRESKLQEGRDFEIKILNAQGDMPTVSSLIDAAVSDRADLLITMSTPTLQAALKRGGQTPIVFTYVASPIAAGAGTSDTDHLPNVTGVYFQLVFMEMIGIIRQCMPSLHTIGSLYVPAETNMVFYKDRFQEACDKTGITLVTTPVNTSTDVPDAALALCTQKIDAICQIPGNLTASAFPSIAAAANKAAIPIFAFQTSQVQNGAVMALGRDYFDAGKETAAMAARVIRGENPKSMPFVAFAKTKIILNYDAAKIVNLNFPTELIKQSRDNIGAAPK